MALYIYNKTNNEKHPFSPFPQLDKYKINSVEGEGLSDHKYIRQLAAMKA